MNIQIKLNCYKIIYKQQDPLIINNVHDQIVPHKIKQQNKIEKIKQKTGQSEQIKQSFECVYEVKQKKVK